MNVFLLQFALTVMSCFTIIIIIIITVAKWAHFILFFIPVPCGACVGAGAATDKLLPSGCRGEGMDAFKIKRCINPA